MMYLREFSLVTAGILLASTIIYTVYRPSRITVLIMALPLIIAINFLDLYLVANTGLGIGNRVACFLFSTGNYCPDSPEKPPAEVIKNPVEIQKPDTSVLPEKKQIFFEDEPKKDNINGYKFPPPPKLTYEEYLKKTGKIKSVESEVNYKYYAVTGPTPKEGHILGSNVKVWKRITGGLYLSDLKPYTANSFIGATVSIFRYKKGVPEPAIFSTKSEKVLSKINEMIAGKTFVCHGNYRGYSKQTSYKINGDCFDHETKEWVSDMLYQFDKRLLLEHKDDPHFFRLNSP